MRLLLISLILLSFNYASSKSVSSKGIIHSDFNKPIKYPCTRYLKKYNLGKKYHNKKVIKRYKRLINICNKG